MGHRLALARDDVYGMPAELDQETLFSVESEAMVDVARHSNLQVIGGVAVFQPQVEGVR